MTDEYEKAVSKLITYLDQTVTFAKGELPDVAQQWLVYAAYSNQVWLIFFSVLTFLSVLAFLRGVFDDYGDGSWAFFGALFSIVFGASSMANYLDLAKIEKAPKLYIMQAMRSELSAATCKK
jgi:hypothetical protein